MSLWLMPFLNFTDQVAPLLIVLATLFVLPRVQWHYRGTLFTYNLANAQICIFDHVTTQGWHRSLKSYLPELFVFNIFKSGKMAHVSGWYLEMHFMSSEFWLNFDDASSSWHYVSIYWGKDLVPNMRKVFALTSVAFLVIETVYIVHRRICHFIYQSRSSHDDVTILKHFPRYCPFAQGNQRSLVDSPQ